MIAVLGLQTPGIAYVLIVRLRDALFILTGIIHGLRTGALSLLSKKEHV